MLNITILEYRYINTMLNSSKQNKQKFVALFDDARVETVHRELAIFFGPHADSYLKVYETMRKKYMQGSGFFISSWSWPVFFLSFVWFFYRKMYVIGALAILIPVILISLFGSTGMGSIVVFPMFAKAVYVQKGLGSILKADALGLSGVDRDEYLRRTGGVSLPAGVLAAGLYVVILASVIFLAILDLQPLY